MNPDSSCEEDNNPDKYFEAHPATIVPIPKNKRLAATHDLKLLCQQTKPNEYLTPPQEFLVKNVKIKVKDI